MKEGPTLDPQLYRPRQESLLTLAERFSGERLPARIQKAFLQTPRHLFAQRFYSAGKGRWVDLGQESIEDHLDELYGDHPIAIFRDADSRTVATISQPSLVLHMLDLLDLQPGQSVFELGGGSGWNAAMMGRLVGAQGHVRSVEIIETLAASAQAAVAKLGLSQVEIVAGDGSRGCARETPFDRGVFTASALDLPAVFYEQIARNGLLLFVVKLRSGLDLLALLRKAAPGRFDSQIHFPCMFVPVTGEGGYAPAEPMPVSEVPGLNKGLAAASRDLAWAELSMAGPDIPAFLAFAETVFDCRQPYLLDNPTIGYAEEFSGVRATPGSLALFNDDRVCALGGEESLIELKRAAKRWLKAGKPGLEDLALSIHLATSEPEPQGDQWIVRRGESLLRWRLPAGKRP